MKQQKKGTPKAAKQKSKPLNASKASSSDADEELGSNGDLPEYGNGIDTMENADEDQDETFSENGTIYFLLFSSIKNGRKIKKSVNCFNRLVK